MTNLRSYRFLLLPAVFLFFFIPEVTLSQVGDGPISAAARPSAGRGSASGEGTTGGIRSLHVEGRVQTLEGLGVSDAKVRLEFGDGRGQVKQTETDISGHFTGDFPLKLNRKEVPRVKVFATKPGFEDARAEASLIPGRPPEIYVTILGVNEDPLQISKQDLIQRLAPRLKAVRDELPDAARQEYGTLAAVLLDRDNADRAVPALEQLADKNPACVDCATLASLALLSLGDWDAFTRRSAEAAAANRKNAHPRPEPLLLVAAMESWRRKPEKAVVLFKEALTLRSDDPLALEEIGRVQLQMNDDEAAEQALAKAVEAGAPPDAHLLLAAALMRTNDIPKAQSEMEKYVAGREVKTLPLSSRMIYNRLRMREELLSYGAVKSLVDEPLGKIEKEVPELKGIHAARSQAELPRILKKVGEGVAEFFAGFPDTVSTEQVVQAVLKGDDKPVRESRRAYKYLLLTKPEGKGVGLEEYRTDAHGSGPDAVSGEKNFMLTSGFASISLHLHPAYQSGSDFRLLGTQELEGRQAEVVLFAQNPARAQIYGVFSAIGHSKIVLIQGIAWIDPSSGHILRMRTELLKPLDEIQLTTETTEIEYRPVTFKIVPKKYWLPHEVVVNVTWKGRKLRNDHTYSEFN
ncbi:MAG: hypothetical protein ACM3NO_03930, partial [Deltaproteobacteria bacterium]